MGEVWFVPLVFEICFFFSLFVYFFSFGGIQRAYLHKQVFFVFSGYSYIYMRAVNYRKMLLHRNMQIKYYFQPTLSLLIGMHVTGDYLKMKIFSS